MKHIKLLFENTKFKKGDIVFLRNTNLVTPLKPDTPYIIKSVILPQRYFTRYKIEVMNLDYQFSETILMSKNEYIEQTAQKYNL